MLFKGHGIVWDKEKDKRLCAFGKAGNFETEDPRVIKILKKLGYESFGSEIEAKIGRAKKITEEEPSLKELKTRAKELGIKLRINASKEDYMEAIQLLEANPITAEASVPDEDPIPDEEL